MTTIKDSFENFLKTDALPLAGLVGLLVALFSNALSGYWRADDPSIILHALNSSGLSAFYDPQDWRKLSPSSLTPWLTFSFKADLWWAGLTPSFFYLHSIVSLGLVAAAAYVLGRFWLTAFWSFAAVCLFLMGASTVSVVDLLMTRHYLEGLLFSLLSLIAFVYAVKSNKLAYTLVGALFYLMAVSAKEIYVPLVAVVMFLPILQTIKQRLKFVAAYVLVALFYIVWRRYMLGVTIGGYVDTASVFSIQSLVGLALALAKIPEFFFGIYWKLPAFLCGAIWLVASLKNAKVAAFFGVVLACVFVPLVPLVSFPGISSPDRYLFLFWFVASFVTAFAASQVSSIKISEIDNIWPSNRFLFYLTSTAFIAVVVFTLQNSIILAKSRADGYREFETQGRFYFEQNDRAGIIPSQVLLDSFWHVNDICSIKKRLSKTCPVSIVRGLTAKGQTVEKLFAYDAASGAMVERPGSIADEIAKAEAVDNTLALQVSVSLTDGWCRWDLGPYASGRYYFVSSSIGRYPVSRNGVLRINAATLEFQIQHESPDGRVTGSPVLVVNSSNPVVWNRPDQK